MKREWEICCITSLGPLPHCYFWCSCRLGIYIFTLKITLLLICLLVITFKSCSERNLNPLNHSFL
ncbi:hypothetical protein CW304_27740 [Bacillus sp. UFRGS-B20]|nr:hypothetical protein CW304_27740 [Bacillus sp. UFRGS-B20]